MHDNPDSGDATNKHPNVIDRVEAKQVIFRAAYLVRISSPMLYGINLFLSTVVDTSYTESRWQISNPAQVANKIRTIIL